MRVGKLCRAHHHSVNPLATTRLRMTIYHQRRPLHRSLNTAERLIWSLNQLYPVQYHLCYPLSWGREMGMQSPDVISERQLIWLCR